MFIEAPLAHWIGALLIMLALGVAFTVGTRPAAVVVVFVDIVILVTAVVVTRAHRSWSEQQPIVTGIVIGTIAVLGTSTAILSLVIGLALLVAPFIVAFSRPDAEKLSAYECGFDAFDDAHLCGVCNRT